MEPLAIVFMAIFWTLIISMSVTTLRALLNQEKNK